MIKWTCSCCGPLICCTSQTGGDCPTSCPRGLKKDGEVPWVITRSWCAYWSDNSRSKCKQYGGLCARKEPCMLERTNPVHGNKFVIQMLIACLQHLPDCPWRDDIRRYVEENE